MSAEIKIRSLTVKDRKVLSSLIKDTVSRIKNKALLNTIKSSANVVASKFTGGDKEEVDESDKIESMGIDVIRLILDTVDNECSAWFASLIGVSVEEFDNLPFDTEIVIIEQLKEAEAFKDFFSKASRLFSSIKPLGNQ